MTSAGKRMTDVETGDVAAMMTQRGGRLRLQMWWWVGFCCFLFVLVACRALEKICVAD